MSGPPRILGQRVVISIIGVLVGLLAGVGLTLLFNIGWMFVAALLLLATLTVGIILAANAESWFGDRANATIAAFVISAPMIPGIAVVLTVIGAISLPKLIQVGRSDLNNEMAVGVGTLAAVLAWLLIATLCRHFTSADRAHPQSYGNLQERAERLCAHLRALCQQPPSSADLLLSNMLASPPVSSPYDSLSGRIAHLEVKTHYTHVAEELGLKPAGAKPSAGLQWASYTGYVTLWNSIHRAEEALLLIEPDENVVSDALYDEWRLSDSMVANRDNLLPKLRAARQVLAQSTCFDESASAPMSSPAPLQRQAPPASEEVRIREELEARAILCKVRRCINEFRDNRRSGLVRARNRLIKTGILTSLAAYVLFSVAVIDGMGGQAIIAAAAFYLVGAIVGLFNRLRLDTDSDDAVEDYGLTSARLICTPLFSGLGAIGGVVLVAMLPIVLNTDVLLPKLPSPPVATAPTSVAPQASAAAAPSASILGTPPAASATVSVTPTRTIEALTPTLVPSGTLVIPAQGQGATASQGQQVVEHPTPLGDIFDLEKYPFGVIIAAVFGFTPGLLVDQLKRQSDQYKVDLKSTQASERGPKSPG